jgi:hypothetical protein
MSEKSEKPDLLEFSSIRTDWYHSNSTLPRLVRSCLAGRKELVFCGFPRQWIPFFEWYGVPWRGSVSPKQYLPFFSDLSESQIVEIVNNAKQHHSLRNLVESASMYDPVLVDFLQHMDHSLDSRVTRSELDEVLSIPPTNKRRPLILTGWQSYGRKSVRQLEEVVLTTKAKAPFAVVLPCSVTRPYHKSLLHKRLYALLDKSGYSVNQLHRIVFTSLGVLPEEVWETPQVMLYDARVPDLYRILRLARAYFGRANYECVLDGQKFVPYSDILRIVEREGVITRLVPLHFPGKSHYYVRSNRRLSTD